MTDQQRNASARERADEVAQRAPEGAPAQIRVELLSANERDGAQRTLLREQLGQREGLAEYLGMPQEQVRWGQASAVHQRWIHPALRGKKRYGPARQGQSVEALARDFRRRAYDLGDPSWGIVAQTGDREGSFIRP